MTISQFIEDLQKIASTVKADTEIMFDGLGQEVECTQLFKGLSNRNGKEVVVVELNIRDG